MDCKKQAYEYFTEGDYPQAVNLYEKVIKSESDIDNTLSYWYLGLALLLDGQEVEAQMVWMMPLSDGETEKIEQYTEELLQVLEIEAERLRQLQEYKLAWLIRQHIREINSDDLNNILNIIQLSSRLNIYDEELPLSQAAQLIQSATYDNDDIDKLLQTLELILEVYPVQVSTFDFIQACISTNYKSIKLIDIFCEKASLFINSLSPEKTSEICDLCLKISSSNIGILANFANLYQCAGKNLESLKFTATILDLSPEILDEIAANYLTIRALIRIGGNWQQAELAHERYEYLLQKLIKSNCDVSEDHIINLITTVAFAPYFKDNPPSNHAFRNQIAQFSQSRIQTFANQEFSKYQQEIYERNKDSDKILKIGYISSCLRRHSVGWLSRWILNYHNCEKFHIYAYSLEHTNDSLQQFISQQVWEFNDLSSANIIEIAEKIYQDQIDILIDLDSITSRRVCGVMALKPAPVQVTWLGSDASGLPAIDYFIADPYVLPQSADTYYASKIWRLPNTYVAVDGFEIGTPTLHREDLNIPNDAVIYLTSQTAYKRHPNTVRLQIKILKKVPESYLLIKGQSNQDTIKGFFEKISEEEGVDISRLRFLPLVDLESVHRANLGIADIVLDTYPYNGATTTLETLWMGIPLVTRVGEQFAARNSYTMMMNAGIEEGIAWTDEEYIEWGIRLGKDENLRQQVAWKLRKSRHSAPLWNAKQFTREMEKAYQQMWQIYVEGS